MAALYALLALLLSLAAQSTAAGANHSQSGRGGPVSGLMESLAYNTATITDEMQLQFGARVDRLSALLLGSVEVIVATALDQLAAPLIAAERQLAAGQCQPPGWTGMEALLQGVNGRLSNCTQDLGEIREALLRDAAAVGAAIEQAVKDIVALPALCQKLTSGDAFASSFASSASCFVEKIVDINQQLSAELNRAALLLTHTRQSSRSAVADAELCAGQVVDEVGRYLEEALQNC